MKDVRSRGELNIQCGHAKSRHHINGARYLIFLSLDCSIFDM